MGETGETGETGDAAERNRLVLGRIANQVALVERALLGAGPGPAATEAGRLGEMLLREFVRLEEGSNTRGQKGYEKLLVAAGRFLPKRITAHFRVIQSFRNIAAHAHTHHDSLTSEDVLPCLASANQVVQWLAVTKLSCRDPPRLRCVPMLRLDPARTSATAINMDPKPRESPSATTPVPWVLASSGSEAGATAAPPHGLTQPVADRGVTPRGSRSPRVPEPDEAAQLAPSWLLLILILLGITIIVLMIVLLLER